MNEKTTFVHAADAALAGLAAAVRGDQCLVHGSGPHGYGAENQVISRHVQAFTDQPELVHVWSGVAKLPAGYAGLRKVSSANAEAHAQCGLADAVRAPRSGKARAKTVGRGLLRFGAASLLGSPQANVLVLEAGEPFVFKLAVRMKGATLDQRPLTWHGVSVALGDIELNKLNTGARDALSMTCDAGGGVNTAANLDVPVAEMADVEVFHALGLLLCGEHLFAALDGLKKVQQRLDGFDAGVGSLVHQLAGEALSNACRLGNCLPSVRTDGLQIANEVVFD